ncbi:MAG: hypothetical protein DI626_04590 [Micavibrio aeruginosavorus]|uniref:Uncharacterized protein n=1 Tax=Micavibrio aeruginosavorus TaxID=349221 RepID=A0A2W5A0S3_9BACT|nr:MAG: hypothetical protein DI626_04590 [Micavibrio aeruginosavorus]
MNIDLFLTDQSESGLVCEGVFPSPVAGIILDAQTREVTLEFADQSTFHLNIPIGEGHTEKLLFAHRMYVGYFDNKMLADSFEAPLLYLNDPYGSEFGQNSPLARTTRSVPGFEQFMKRCNFAQALHRDNLGDEATAHSVLKGANLQALMFTPALQRQMQMNAVPKVQSAPAMGLGGGGATRQVRNIPKKSDGEEK